MIKIYLFIGLTFFLLNVAKAQYFKSAFMPYWIIQDEEKNAQNLKTYNFNYKSITVTSEKKIVRYIFNYDKDGRVCVYSEQKAKNSEKNEGFILRYAASEKKLEQRLFEFKNDVVYQSDSSVYNKYGEMITYLRFDKNNQIKYRVTCLYDSTFLKEYNAYSYKNGVEKISGQTVYQYDIDFQLKNIIQYNKKGKAINKTVFDCNPIGVN